MFFLNLSAAEFLAALGALSSLVLALYLLDRARRKQTVATLRFFAPAHEIPRTEHRRRLRQPWSLILQLVSLALLLLALAQPRVGAPENAGRDHVLLLDTSAWMASRGPDGEDPMARAKSAAKSYLDTLPAGDRVLLIRAGALATPVGGFESGRRTVASLIDASSPGPTALNLAAALASADEARSNSGRQPGEIVFAGIGRMAGEEQPSMPRDVRLLPAGQGALDNCGLRKVVARRSREDPGVWEIFVSLKNFSRRARSVSLLLSFGGAPAASRSLVLDAGEEAAVTLRYRTRAAGWLEARLLPRDGFPGDNRAVLELPRSEPLPITVYTSDPALLTPVFGSIPGVRADFEPPSKYSAAATAGIVVLDGFAPPVPPRVNALWIDPPAGRSPIRVRATLDRVKLTRWRSSHELGAGLRTRDVEIERASIFDPEPSDIPVAEGDAGPIIAARPGPPRIVVVGFHPLRTAMKYRLATPLLFANIVRWLAPGVFGQVQYAADMPGIVDAPIDGDAGAVEVLDEARRPLPFTVHGSQVRFFSGSPGMARVIAGGRETVYSLTLAAPGDTLWNAAGARKGLPARTRLRPESRDVWQALALAGGAGLLAEWLLFGAPRRGRPSSRSPGSRAPRKAS